MDGTILLTGGHGFLGRAIHARLGDSHVVRPRSSDCDLRSAAACAQLLREVEPRVIIHAAGTSGGLGAVRAEPGRFFHDNLVMAMNLIEAARAQGLCMRDGLLVMVGHMTSYPAEAPMPLKEDDLFSGRHDANAAPLGVAKLAAWQMLDAYHRQYGFRSAFVIPVNLYGPGDNFDPATSHFIGALVHRTLEMKRLGEPKLVCWGDGTPTRDFLYVDDAAEGVVRAAECEWADGPAPVNLCPGVEYSIKDVVQMIVECAEYEGEVVWDTTKPKGQPRRVLDATRAAELLGWRAQTSLRDGLETTIRATVLRSEAKQSRDEA